MYEEDGTSISRLSRIQNAASSAIQKLKPTDTLALVAFAHNAQVVLPATPLSQKAQIEEVIQKIDQFDVDPGGTAMDAGMQLALSELEKNARPGTLSQMLVLTDGETSGEKFCRDLSKQAAEKKIHLTMIGVGTEWNSNLIKDLANIGQGKWHYIDVNNALDAERVFVEEFQSLAAAAFTNVEMHLRLLKDIKVKRVRQVVPDIKTLETTEPEERHLVAQLGTLEKDKGPRYILDMTLPKRPDGKFKIADLEITYEAGEGNRETTGPIPL